MNQIKSGLAAVVAAGAALTGGQAVADVYVGASIGDATLKMDDLETNCYYCDESDATYDFDSNDTAYKIFGGYMFNEYVGVEMGYVDLGSQSDDTKWDSYYGGETSGYDGGESLDVEMTGFTAQLVGQYPIGPVDIFAKAGFFDYDSELESTYYQNYSESSTSVSDYSYSEEGTDWVYGVGATYNVGAFGVRAEYEMFDLKASEVDDLYMWSIGVEYHIQ